MAGGAFDSGYYSNEMSRSNGHKWNNKRPARRMRALIMTARAGTRVWLTETQQDRAWAASEQRPFRIFPVSLLWLINSAWLLYVKSQVFEVMCRQAPSEFQGGLGSRRSVFTVRQYSPYVCKWTVKESYSYSRTQPFNWAAVSPSIQAEEGNQFLTQVVWRCWLVVTCFFPASILPIIALFCLFFPFIYFQLFNSLADTAQT